MINIKVTKYLAKHGVWHIVSNVLLKLNTLIITWLCASILLTEEFGRFSLIQSTIVTFQVFSVLGLEVTATKLISENKNNRNETINAVLKSCFVLSFATSLILVLFSEYIATDFFNDPSFENYIILVSPVVFLYSIRIVLGGVFLGLEKNQITTKVNMISSVFGLIIAFPLIYCYKLNGAILSLLVIELLSIIIFCLVIFRESVFKFNLFEIEKKAIKQSFKLCLPISFSGMLVMPVNFYLMKEIAVYAGYLEVGSVNVLNQWQALLLFLPVSLSTVLLPYMSKKENKSNDNLLSTIIMFVLFSLTVSLIYFICSPFIIKMYGEELFTFVTNENILAMCWCVVVITVSNLMNNKLISDGKVSVLVIGNVIWSICILSAYKILVVELSVGVVTAFFVARAISYTFKIVYMTNFMIRN